MDYKYEVSKDGIFFKIREVGTKYEKSGTRYNAIKKIVHFALSQISDSVNPSELERRITFDKIKITDEVLAVPGFKDAYFGTIGAYLMKKLGLKEREIPEEEAVAAAQRGHGY